jgi:hypothetical protein
MLSGSPLATRLWTLLQQAPTREQASRAIESLHSHTDTNAHGLRSALAEVLAVPLPVQSLTWTALESVRHALEQLDLSLDRTLAAISRREPVDALAQELLACGIDRSRTARSLDLVWRSLCPPSSHANAVLIDLLRSHPLGAARVCVYLHLVEQGADIRTVLADDAVLSVPDRLNALCAFAARTKAVGKTRTILWNPDARTALSRTLSDWTMYATHPRHVLYRFRTHFEWSVTEEYLAALEKLPRKILPREVNAILDEEQSTSPRELHARALSAGRFECGLCGESKIYAHAHRLLDPTDPLQGAETEFVCPVCHTRYYSQWDLRTHSHGCPVAPIGWG